MVIKITDENYNQICLKIQEELADIIENNIPVDDYKIIMYKYLFISELKVPLWEDLGIEIKEDSFILYIIPDDLEFKLLRRLDELFDRFTLSFMPNEYKILKLKFKLE